MKNKRAALKYILSFFIPVIFVAVAFATLGVYPGGPNLILTYDLRAQLFPLYAYLSHSGPGFDNLFYSMSGALGGGFFGTLALYISPFDLIYSFFPVRVIPNVIYYVVLTKIGACGLSMCFFLDRNRRFTLSAPVMFTFSCCYALMSYNMTYFMSPMWFDAVIFLPLLAVLAEKIISGKRSLSFILLMAFMIISDYYMAYMVAIALTIYMIFRFAEENSGLMVSVRKFLTYIVHGIASALVSMVVLLPVVLDFGRGKIAEGTAAKGDMIKNSLLDVLSGFKAQSYAGLDFNASPNVFCGSIVLIFVLLWLTYGKRDLKARITGLCIIIFYFICFIFGPLDRAWHGFKEPVCFSCRYSFTFVFILICFAARGYSLIKTGMIKISSSHLSLISFIVIFYTFIELYINGAYILSSVGTDSKYTYAEEFYRYCDAAEDLIPYDELNDPDGYGRIVANYRFSYHDGALFGYDGLSYFSSSYNYEVSTLMRSLGIASLYHTTHEKGMTPPIASLINARYVLSSFTDMSDFYVPVKESGKYTLYKNENALPIAFEIHGFSDNVLKHGEDPFENINLVYSELTGEDSRIFINEKAETILGISQADDIKTESDLEFTCTNTGHYFFYCEYSADDMCEEDSTDTVYGKIHTTVRKLLLDGEPAGDFGDATNSYIVDLGSFNAGEKHALSVCSSADEIGNVYICYYDDSLFEALIRSVNGYKLTGINAKGIELKGTSENDSDVLVSVPFEPGYSVYVDGVKTGYSSYRKSLLTIPVSSGDHVIKITYIPPGLAAGSIISLVSLSAVLLYYFISRKKAKS